MTATQQPSTKQHILNHLLKQGHATAQDLAHQLEISAQATRRHLKDLEDEGLIHHETIQVGMGRPNYIYKLSQIGHHQFPDRYDEFAVSLLTTLAATVDKKQFSDILRKQWEQKALEYRDRLGSGSLQDRVAALVEIRRAEGYMAEWHLVDAEKLDAAGIDAQEMAAPHYVITEYNCAISQIAESFPSVCGHELEMFELALEGCKVERTHWMVGGEHQCGYLVRVA
ncbi:MAG TPA: iron-sulfur cluster biosynthesis transcriptional regulator SufR [Coleofasciculaceae cyanobacterium]|jgi:DeoR family suf operon transcriptional repressor